MLLQYAHATAGLLPYMSDCTMSFDDDGHHITSSSCLCPFCLVLLPQQPSVQPPL